MSSLFPSHTQKNDWKKLLDFLKIQTAHEQHMNNHKNTFYGKTQGETNSGQSKYEIPGDYALKLACSL